MKDNEIEVLFYESIDGTVNELDFIDYCLALRTENKKKYRDDFLLREGGNHEH